MLGNISDKEGGDEDRTPELLILEQLSSTASTGVGRMLQ